ncbi:hypothetical protein LguiB_023431 [Lonicera macranthoides]
MLIDLGFDCNYIIIRGICAFIFGFVFSCSTTITLVHSKTDAQDVSSLNVMYSSLNSPSELDGWKSKGGDPCGDSWRGITCSGSSVTDIDLSDMGLTGSSLGYQLSSLKSVTNFDLSKNKLKGDIPYQLPPNARQIDLSENGFTGAVPYSISQMKKLEYLNLRHNKLNGQLSDMFGQLSKLAEMLYNLLHLIYDVLWGQIPLEYVGTGQTLMKLAWTRSLQNNKFTGSINVLADLPLEDFSFSHFPLSTTLQSPICAYLAANSVDEEYREPCLMHGINRNVCRNVANNKFTGWIPDDLKGINKIETGGNSWSTGPAPPPPPGQKSNHARTQSRDTSRLGGAAIAGIVLAVLVVIGVIVAIFSRRRSSPPSHFLEEDRLSQRRPFTPLASHELSNELHAESPKDSRELKSSDSFTARALQTSPSIGFRPPPSNLIKSFKDKEFGSNKGVKRSGSFHVTCYPLADLQTATANFATGRLLGEGSLGRVYKAKYADGKVLAVKKLDSSLFQRSRRVEFTETVSNISKLCHPNIAGLVGYCSEMGHNMLVYEYFRNGSLHEFLHLSDDFSKPLTWNTRVRIALGTARAVEYLHEGCSPSYVHKNIKSSNIFLDSELNPHLSDCGLAIFHQSTSQNLGTGYNAPECTIPSAYTLKSDVYSFGVVMLELLTGRKPYDSSKPRLEQSLVRWATPQLHDIDALAKMVDPALRGLYPPKSLSRFADVIALCMQSEPEFRPPMSEVVQALVRLVQRSSMRIEDPAASRRTEDSD